MIHIKLNPSTGEKSNSFVGIKVVDNELEFSYPESYTLCDDKTNLKKDILNILRTINLADKKTRDVSSLNKKFKENNSYPLYSYLFIISDYLKNKRYINKEKVYKVGQYGKIDWNRTMRLLPFISDKNIVFPFLISEYNKQQDNLLTEIYAFCVVKSVNEIGWYFGLSSGDVNLGKFTFNRNRYLSVLNGTINKTFNDIKRERLVHMKNIVTGLDDKKSQSKVFIRGVDSYEHIFESMVDDAFGNIEYKEKFFPNSKWILASKETKESSNLRPDTIIFDKKNKKVYILDSKYYRYGHTFDPNDLPNTTSIEKQITYSEYAKKISNGKDYDEVLNAFILPYSMKNNKRRDTLNKEFEYIGYAVANWPQDAYLSSKKIIAILVDLRFLIENYLKMHDSYTQKLIDLIEEKIDKEP